MLFRGRDCQEVTNCEIIINNIPLNNANEAVDLGHTLSTEKREILYLLPLLSSGVVLIFKADFGHIHSYVQCKFCKQ